MGDVRVKLEQLEKRFPRSNRAALSGISAEIKPGIITGLVGPDGAGKTTLLRLLAGLLLPTAGQILLEDATGSGSSPEQSDPQAKKSTDTHRLEGNPTAKPTREWIGYICPKNLDCMKTCPSRRTWI